MCYRDRWGSGLTTGPFQTDRLPVISARVEARAGPCIAQKASLYGHKHAPPGANVYYVPGVTRKPASPLFGQHRTKPLPP